MVCLSVCVCVCVAEVVVHVGVGVVTCGSVCKGAHSPVIQMRESGLGSRNFC